jgi:hypothetical protein
MAGDEMTGPEIGVTLLVDIDLLTAEQRGRTEPVQSGYLSRTGFDGDRLRRITNARARIQQTPRA